MKFEFEIADRQRTVEVHRQSHAFRIVIDGRAHLVDAVRLGDDSWSLIVRDVESGRIRSADAVVVPQNGNGAFDVYIDGQRIPVWQPSGFGRRARAAGGSQGSGPQRVTAPMPGKILKVLIHPGDEVKARQGLIVVEAMKMENELRAARDGRVREVLVEEGQSVEAGTALVTVE